MGSIRAIKEILTIRIKPRNDDYSDQFCRLLMPKMFIISALVMGVDFFSDEVSCIVPKTSNLGKDFVHSVCWIQGFYIYTELKGRLDESSYYGIPRNIDKDGIDSRGNLCQRRPDGIRENKDCKLMKKTFYSQFQWMPFFIASLALMHYFPYLLFRIINTDMISLKKTLKTDATSKLIVNNYFNYKINSRVKMKIRACMNALIKLLYMIVTIVCFYLCNLLLNGDYYDYGVQWIRWTHLNNTVSHDKTMREFPKPGNVLLPPMGYCEIEEKVKAIHHSFINTNKVVCEISPNILYQYVFIILWFFIIFSIVISCTGFIFWFIKHVYTFALCYTPDDNLKSLFKVLEYRECEYILVIGHENKDLYKKVVNALKRRHSISTDCIEVTNETEDRSKFRCFSRLVKLFSCYKL